MLDLRKFVWVFLGFTIVALVAAYFIYDYNMPLIRDGFDPVGSDAISHHGIDVSYHSGAVDWPSVAAQGFRFAIVKATEGEDFKDPSFDRHWRELGSAGLIRGAYHFYVTEDDPDTQAQFFIRFVSLQPGDLAPVVDIEMTGHNTKPGLADRFRRYLTILESYYGTKPIIYTSARFWNQHLGGGFGEYPLWVAEYQVDAPIIPDGWDSWHLWQWQGDTTIAGVEGGADLTRLNSEIVELSDLMVGLGRP